MNRRTVTPSPTKLLNPASTLCMVGRASGVLHDRDYRFFNDPSCKDKRALVAELQQLLAHMRTRLLANALTEKEGYALCMEFVTRYDGLLPTKCNGPSDNYVCQELFVAYDRALALLCEVENQILEAAHV